MIIYVVIECICSCEIEYIFYLYNQTRKHLNKYQTGIKQKIKKKN